MYTIWVFATFQCNPEASVEGVVGGDVSGDQLKATLSSLSFARPTTTSDTNLVDIPLIIAAYTHTRM